MYRTSGYRLQRPAWFHLNDIHSGLVHSYTMTNHLSDGAEVAEVQIVLEVWWLWLHAFVRLRLLTTSTGIDPAPDRAAQHVAAQSCVPMRTAMLACDFFETFTLTGARMSVLAVRHTAAHEGAVAG